MTAKKLFLNARVIFFLVVLILSLVAINPRPLNDGVAIRSVVTGSAAADAGIPQPSPTATPISRERILEINNQEISDMSEYVAFINTLDINDTFQIKTNKALYRLRTKEAFEEIELNETVLETVEEEITVTETINGTETEVTQRVNKTVEVPKTELKSLGMEEIGLEVFPSPKTNIKKGLDLQGGTRVLLEPEVRLIQQDLDSLIENLEKRLNVYGLSDLVIKEASDLFDNQFILIEIAGANEEEIQKLITSQGKFEAKIANQTVFVGGTDIRHVCKSADCAGIDPNFGCQASGANDHTCRFRFSITLTPEAAQKQADVTNQVPLASDTRYLADPLQLILDDVLVDELNIGADLQGSPTTEIQISGSGFGASQNEALFDALANMKELQTILDTGSLPVKLNVVKIDAVSPLLGESFLTNALIAGLVALLVVGVFIFIRYRKLEIAVPMVIVTFTEVVILFGVAALIGWNIDLAAVAGIIIVVGTGIDHQIVIADETMRGQRQASSWKDRFKNAFFIIMASYFTIVVAMFPLMFAGAGLLKGFAITTLIGASIGVFITRPVYAKAIEILLKNKE